MAGVQLVCDSTADLDPAFRDEHQVIVVPLKVIFGDDVYADGVDIDPDSFYRRMRAGETPRTSQPTPADFRAAFESVPAGTPIVCTTISSELSGTHASAVTARAELGDRDITVIDTRSAAVGHNAVVRAAATAAAGGAGRGEVVAAAGAVVASQRLLFTVETLEYLRRGGRIGGARALVGSVLDIKPILSIDDGAIEPVDRVRTFGKALDRILAAAGEWAEQWHGGVITLGEAGSTGLAEVLAGRARAAMPGVEVHTAVVGPAIGTHGGPGAVGLAAHPPIPSPATAR